MGWSAEDPMMKTLRQQLDALDQDGGDLEELNEA